MSHLSKINLPAQRLSALFRVAPHTLVALIALLVAISLPSNVQARSSFDISGTGQIQWIADGDTVKVRLDDRQVFNTLKAWAMTEQTNRQRDLQVNRRFDSASQTILVRIASIDTDESVHPDPTRNSASGIKASDFAKHTFSGPVTVRCAEIGFYGRPICSVQGTFGDWGIRMIEAGMSDYQTRYGRHPFNHQGYLNAARKR